MNISIMPNGLVKLFSHPAWMLIAAFGTYFCMYGFRKPYTAAFYSGSTFWGLDYKFLLIIAQTIGYVSAKWAGVKIIAEVKPGKRISFLLTLILLAEGMLLLLGVTPRPWNIVFLFLNGLFLGMVFGLVLGFLEGRKNTEALIAGLCASFIVSDGVSKTVGTMLLNLGINENWMPFFAGLVFMVPALIFIAMLSRVPAPSAEDIKSRSKREPMDKKARLDFFANYAPGLLGVLIFYLFVTLLRSIRADFAPEIWHGLGYAKTPAIFTQSELIVSFGTVLINGFIIFIKQHKKALNFAIIISFAGFIIALIALWGLQHGLNSFAFMVLAGLGVYIPYVAVHTTIFERLIAVTKEHANIGFLMYLADSAGYTGYVLLMFLKYLILAGTSILQIFLWMCLYLGLAGAVLTGASYLYFKRKLKNKNEYYTPVAAR